MKLKQISPVLFKLFIPCDELEETGVNWETLSIHSLDTHFFFYKIVHEALMNNGSSVNGTYQIDIYTYSYYGIYMILNIAEGHSTENMELDIEESLSINIQERDQMIYEFADFDDVVQACKTIQEKWDLVGILYYWQSNYYLEIKGESRLNQATIMAILLEFSEFSILNKEFLAANGNKIGEDNIITIIKKYF